MHSHFILRTSSAETFKNKVLDILGSKKEIFAQELLDNENFKNKVLDILCDECDIFSQEVCSKKESV